MTKQVQRRRGTSTQHTSFTGAEGEISVNTSNKTVHVHDGSTAGGFEAALASLDNVSVADVSSALSGVDNIDINGGTIDGTTIGGNSAAAITGTTVTGTSFVSSGNMTFGDNDKAIFGAGNDLQIWHQTTGTAGSYIAENGTGDLRISGNNLWLNDASGDTYFRAVNGSYAKLYHAGDEKIATTSTGVDVTGTLTSDGLTVDGTTVLDSETNFVADTYASNKSLVLASEGATGGNGTLGASVAFSRINTKSPRAAIAAINTDSNFERMGLSFWTHQDNFANVMKKRMVIDHQGDISFYEDTGTTPKFFWDASAEALGIGTVSPGRTLDVQSASGDADVRIYAQGTTSADDAILYLGGAGTTATNRINFGDADDADRGRIIYGHSGDYMSFTTATEEALRIDSSGNVGIGTSSPKTNLDLSSATGPQITLTRSDGTNIAGDTLGRLNFYNSDFSGDGANNAAIIEAVASASTGSSADLLFRTKTAGTEGADAVESMRIDRDGNVGIGTSSPSAPMQVVSTSGSIPALGAASSHAAIGSGGFGTMIGTKSTGDGYIQQQRFDGTATAYDLLLQPNGGNVLVGTTDSNVSNNSGTSNSGINLLATGQVFAAYAGNVANFNQLGTSGGSIINFDVDGSTVGAIAAGAGGFLTIGSPNGTPVYATFANGSLKPTTSLGSNSDGSGDLGNTSSRWKDLYLSGGVYLGGTGSANKLDDYEEGTYVPTITCSTSGSITLNTSYDDLAYTKIGNTVHVHGRIRVSSVSSPVGVAKLSMPFASANLAGDAGRVSGVCYMQGGSNNMNEYGIHPTVEGHAYVELARMSGDAFDTTIANHFSGNELVYVSVTYRTS